MCQSIAFAYRPEGSGLKTELAKLVGGKEVAEFALELRGVSNEKAKRELGWQPAHPSWRSGFAETFVLQRETV